MAAVSSSGSRAQLLEATIIELARHGSDAVDLGAMCRRIGISPSLVNHHFGGRSPLLLEAAMVAYERYVEGQVAVVRAAGEDPEAQLAAWISAQVEWTIQHPGVASVMNFPALHLPEGRPLEEDARLRLEHAAARNLITLASIVHRIQRGERGLREVTREEVAQDLGLASATAYLGWLVYGHALWRAGRHAPTTDIPEVRLFEQVVFAGLPRVAAQLARGLSGRPQA